MHSTLNSTIFLFLYPSLYLSLSQIDTQCHNNTPLTALSSLARTAKHTHTHTDTHTHTHTLQVSLLSPSVFCSEVAEKTCTGPGQAGSSTSWGSRPILEIT